MNKTLKAKLAILCIALSFTATAQKTKDSASNSIFGLYVVMPIDFPIIDNNAMRKELISIGFPDCKPPGAALGLGFQIHGNHTILALTYSQLSRRPKSDSTDLAIQYHGFSFNFGYDLLHTARLSLYPYAGLNGCGLKYSLTRRLPDTAATTLKNYFNTTLDHKEIDNTILHFDVGVGMALRSFYLVNLRAGYLLPLERSEWTVLDRRGAIPITDAPKTRYKAYITLTLGLGNIYDEKSMRRRYNRRPLPPETGIM